LRTKEIKEKTRSGNLDIHVCLILHPCGCQSYYFKLNLFPLLTSIGLSSRNSKTGLCRCTKFSFLIRA